MCADHPSSVCVCVVCVVCVCVCVSCVMRYCDVYRRVVAVNVALRDYPNLVRRVLIIDLDVHQVRGKTFSPYHVNR